MRNWASTLRGAANFTAWKRRDPNGDETLSANSKSYAPFNTVREKSSAADKKTSYNALRAADSSLELPAWSNATAAHDTLTAWETAHVDQLEDAPESLQTNFFGFNSGGKMSGLFDFVLVTADLRASEESVDGKASIIGRILERSVDRSSADEEIARIVEESRLQQQRVYKDKFEAQLKDVTGKLNAVVATYAPGRAVKVSPAEFELKAPRTTFDVAVLDGTTETAVERQGHGFQRTLLISALQLLAQSGAASADGVICLAIEEPELFQHPIRAQTFAKVLRDLAEDEGKRIQVTYATHSPYFLEAKHFDQVRRLSRTASETPVVTVHWATLEAVKRRLEGVLKSASVDRQLDGVVTNRLGVALFAHRALLVEGPTDAAVIGGIADKSSVGSLEASGLSVVEVGGKSSIPLAHAILTEMGIPAYAVFDADQGYETRATASGKDPVKIAEERASHVAANRMNLKYFALAEVDFPAETVGESVAIFADHLEAFIEQHWPGWAVACAAVEEESGVVLAKNQLAYRSATLNATGEVPEMLLNVLARSRGEA